MKLARVALVLLSLGAGYLCFRTGDLGAKAVWAGRLQAAHHGFPGGPGGPPPGAGAPSAGATPPPPPPPAAK